MSYGISLSKQTVSFLSSFGFGFLLGVVYDMFYIARLLISKSKMATLISDILYVIVAAIMSFILVLVVTDGEVRAYILLGELLGFLTYYFSAGVLVIRTSQKIVAFLKKLFSVIYKIISTPFLLIFRFLHKIFIFFAEKIRKITKKCTKKSKFRLQVNNTLLYNLITNSSHSSRSSNADCKSTIKNTKGRRKKSEHKHKTKKRKEKI